MKPFAFLLSLLSLILITSCAEPEKKPSLVERLIDAAVDKAERDREEAANKAYGWDENRVILAEDLSDAYDVNELRADEQFKDSIFTVEGKIDEIGRDMFDDTPVVDVRGNGLFDIVQCYFAEAGPLTKLNVGDRVRITGRCDGKSGFVEMRECTEIVILP